jgi:hypothetical protein
MPASLHCYVSHDCLLPFVGTNLFSYSEQSFKPCVNTVGFISAIEEHSDHKGKVKWKENKSIGLKQLIIITRYVLPLSIS